MSNFESLQRALKTRDLDNMIFYAPKVEPEHIDESIKELERFYMKEVDVINFVWDVLALSKQRKSYVALPESGCFDIKLDTTVMK